ncbi:hypothetical protein M6B22_11385 [Jatrophihabitans cynanchi]|uniref:Uncharacterized protein n=1 Tax=Jatrophihabitans cynanchi TaxID=2944128 RepID=A0ABY7JRH3_9ACTN|nr:hypothetical protein [Jatrophihabitans sp. SB3-54]WAX55163.1 hypothetical protein M6B22_11385 [Jatrophihabitans sp. SB3-54]
MTALVALEVANFPHDEPAPLDAQHEPVSINTVAGVRDDEPCRASHGATPTPDGAASQLRLKLRLEQSSGRKL